MQLEHAHPRLCAAAHAPHSHPAEWLSLAQAPQAQLEECTQLPHWHPDECESKLANHPGVEVAASAATAKVRREEATPAAILRLSVAAAWAIVEGANAVTDFMVLFYY